MRLMKERSESIFERTDGLHTTLINRNISEIVIILAEAWTSMSLIDDLEEFKF